MEIKRLALKSCEDAPTSVVGADQGLRFLSASTPNARRVQGALRAPRERCSWSWHVYLGFCLIEHSHICYAAD